MRRILGYSLSLALIHLLFVANTVSLAYQLLQSSEEESQPLVHPPSPESQTADSSSSFQVSIADGGFSPAVITVTLSTEVAWINNGTGSHGVASVGGGAVGTQLFLPLILNGMATGNDVRTPSSGMAGRGVTIQAWSSGLLEPGHIFRKPFNQVGSFPYINPFHPEMKGIVVVVQPNQAPTIQITSPTTGDVLGTGPLLVSGSVGDDDIGLTVMVNGINAQVTGTTFAATISMPSGNQTIQAEVQDKEGETALTSIVVNIDGEPPEIQINSPVDRQAVYEIQPKINAGYTDFGSQVDPGSVTVMLQESGASAVDISSSLVITPSGLSGQVPSPLAGDTVYTVTVELSDLFGNDSTQTASFYVPANPGSIQPPVPTGQSGWVSGRVFDSSTCDQDLVTCQGLAGALVTLEVIDAQLMAAVRQQRQNQVLSQLLSDGFTSVDPLFGPTAATPVTGTVLTGPDGFFAFPVELTGAYWLRVEKAGYTYGQRELDLVLGRSTATDSIYLTPADNVVTPCDAAGCSHANSDDSLRLEIPAGAIPGGGPVNLQATWFSNVEFLPSGALPPGTSETYAFDLSAGTEITFTVPVTVQVHNARGFAPSTPIPVGYWNQFTQEWEHVGVSRVDLSGSWLVFTTTHFSPFDTNIPVFPPDVVITVEEDQPDDPNNQDPTAAGPSDKEDEPCNDGLGGCFVGLKSGVLQEWFELPPVQLLGEPEAPRMHYSTDRAHRTELIDARVVMNNIGSSFLKDYIIFELYIAGDKTEIHYIPVMTNTVGELGRFRYLWDGVDSQGKAMPPGVYDYSVKFIIPYTAEYCRALGDVFGAPANCASPTGVFTDGEIELLQGGTVILDGESGSAYGEGWVVQGQQRLYENERGQIVIMDGIRHDEFYFPQKNLLLTTTQTIFAGASYAQLRQGATSSQALDRQTFSAAAVEVEDPSQPISFANLPDAKLSHPANVPPYTQTLSPNGLLTDVCGSLSGTTTWNLIGSPYRVTCDLLVESGATLVIDAGVVVQFQAGTSLFVEGTMNALGTSGQPVTFQAETGTAPGTWRQISFLPGSAGDLQHVIIEHGGNIPNNATLGAVTIGSSQVFIQDGLFQHNQTAVFISGAGPTISHTTFFSNTATYGAAIYLQNNAAPILENSLYQENQAAFNGGAIYAQDSSPGIINSDFLTNSAQTDGGAIYLNVGTATITGNIFTGNTAQFSDGGGVYIYNEAEPSLVQGNSFYLNSASNGGGGALYNDSYNNTIRGNQFISNTASSGGAVTHHDYFGLPESTVFAQNIFQGNSAQRGGAMLVREGDPLLVNNTFASNNASFAGALSLWSRAYVQHNVFWDNSAQSGGAITNHVGDVIPALTNNLIVSNTATTLSGGAIHSEGIDKVSFGDYNLVWGNSTPEYYLALPGPHDIHSDPMFVNPSQMDFHLLSGSPAIDAGTWDIRSNADAEGDMRPMGSTPDIGIDETTAFGVNIQDFPASIGPGLTTSYTLHLFNPDVAGLSTILTHTLPSEAALSGIEDGTFSCVHDGASLGGILVCNGIVPPASQIAISVTMNTNDTVPTPVTQSAVVEAAASGEHAQDQAEGWLEWCLVQVNADPFTTDLQNVIGGVSDGDQVKVSGRCPVGEALDIRDDITLQGGWDRSFTLRQPDIYTTTLDGGYSEAVLQISAGPIVDGFTIVHGVDQSNGVVQFSSGSTAVFQYNEVAHNIGSGIDASNDLSIIQNNNIHHNQGYYYGAGIYSRAIGQTIRNNWIHHNYGAENGGGIYVDRAGTVQNNLIQNNVAQFDGGGLYFSGYQFDPVTIEYNVLYDNQAARGGGMAIEGSAYHVSSAFRNNIIISNTASSGGGIYQPTAFSETRFNNVWNNQGGDYAGAAASIYDVSVDPLFEDPANGDFHLRTASPMIDAGDPFSNFVPDFEGDPRPLGTRVDIGADEYRSLSAFSRTSTDYSLLEFDLVAQSYVRVYPDQTRVVFDTQNRHDHTLAPDGKKTGYSYNADGSIASISITAPGESAPNWVWNFSYLNGRLDSITDPAGRATDVTIDQNNHLTNVEFPDNSERLFFYDSRGLLTQQQDKNGHLTDYGYDPQGRTRLVVYPARAVYDTTSDTTSIIRESRIITPSDTAYPLLNDRLPGSPANPGVGVPLSGHLVDEIKYGRGGLSGTTDRWGYLLTESDGLGRVTNHQRFTSGLPKSTTFPDGDCVEYEYNRHGNPTSETRMPPDQCPLQQNQRDANRLLVWQWIYDARFNRIKTATDPEGRETTYIYDYEVGAGEAGNVVEIIYPAVDDGSGTLVQPSRQFTYNQWGLLETETDPLGSTTRYEYTQGTADEASTGADPRFKPGVSPVPGLLSKEIQDDGGINLITDYQDYDAAGNPGKATGPGGLFVTTYLYDSMNRVVQETDAVGVVTTYAYDGKGNQIEKVVDPGGMNIVMSMVYDAHDLLHRQEVNDGINLTSVSVHYDVNRMPALRVDARGGRTVFLYDEADQLVNQIDPEGYIYTYTYALDGNVATEQDPSGSVSRNVYDNFNRKVEEIVDDGGLSLSTTFEYDLAGNLIAEIAPNGTKSCYVYDNLNRKTSVILDCNGLHLETFFSYDLNGNLLSETNHRGVTTGHSYDALNREIEMILDKGGLHVAAQYTYDTAGNLEKITDHRGSEHIHSYDALNRLTQLCQDATGLNQCVQYSYDALGNVATTTDGEGIVTRDTYNGFSQLLERVEDANGLARSTTYAYDNALNLAAVVDHNGNATHHRYNLRNETVEKRYADGTAVSITYEGRGLHQTATDQAGVTVTNHFDGAGRQITRTLSSGGFQTFAYDQASRLVEAVDALSSSASKVEFAFNPVHDAVAITETLDAQSWASNYGYNYPTGVYTITYPSGENRTFALDPFDRTGSVKDGGGQNIAAFSYQDSQGIDGLTYANGVTETVSFDTLYRPIRTSSSLADYRYGYDGANHRVYRQKANLPGQPSEVYQYNTLYQVANAWHGADDTDPANITSFDRLVQYHQDRLSNRLSVQEGAVLDSYGPNDGSSLNNPMNRYETVGPLSFAYDLNGNLVDDGEYTYAYDALNRQIGAASATVEAHYSYNALNQRVGKVVTTTSGVTTTHFIHDLSAQVIEERDGSNSLLARYTYTPGIDQPLTMERGGDTYYYHRDAQSSVTEISDQAGQLAEQVIYDIYGEAAIKDGAGNPLTGSAVGNPYLYTGRRLDSESGNYYFRARMYHPETGRFMQMDPTGYTDGMNLYASYFVVNKVDPSGQSAETVTLFSASSYTGWGGSIAISTINNFRDCCDDGVRVFDGLRTYGLKLTAEAGVGESTTYYLGGQAVVDLGLKGPKVGATIELTAKNRTCNGTVDAIEFCETQYVFAGASGTLGALGGSVSLTGGIKGTFKMCGQVSGGVLTVKAEFCGESNIVLTYTAGKLAGVLWQPSGYKVTGCGQLFSTSFKLPGS